MAGCHRRTLAIKETEKWPHAELWYRGLAANIFSHR